MFIPSAWLDCGTNISLDSSRIALRRQRRQRQQAD
jgi:hypothetical protein